MLLGFVIHEESDFPVGLGGRGDGGGCEKVAGSKPCIFFRDGEEIYWMLLTILLNSIANSGKNEQLRKFLLDCNR